MKELKYIKLFESFDSDILPKTLKYINEESRGKFLEYLKIIFNTINFPFSNITDSYLDYLPFNAALQKNRVLSDEVCDNTSKRSFGQFGIDGEVCNNGVIKRKWGKSIRNVTCPICNGTGIKPRRNEDIKLIKFWFTSEGRFVGATCVDGIIRKNNSKNPNSDLPDPYSWNTGFGFRYGSEMVVTGYNIENSIKDAHFAIILDYDRLKKSKYDTTTDIKNKRVVLKKGATSFLSDEDIKKENINRYISKISEDIDIANVNDLNRVVKRLIGSSRISIYNIRNGSVKDKILFIINKYLELLKDGDKEYLLNSLISYTKENFRSVVNRSSLIDNNLIDIKNTLKNENSDKLLEIISLLEELSISSYKSITNINIETIEDLEVVYQKVLSIQNILSVSRYSIDKLTYYIEYISRNTKDYSISYLRRIYSPDEVIDGLKRAIRVVNRM